MAAAAWMAKNFLSIWISRQRPPHTSEPSGSEWHWRPPTAGKEMGRLESVANSLIRGEQLVEGERKVSWTSAGGTGEEVGGRAWAQLHRLRSLHPTQEARKQWVPLVEKRKRNEKPAERDGGIELASPVDKWKFE